MNVRIGGIRALASCLLFSFAHFSLHAQEPGGETAPADEGISPLLQAEFSSAWHRVQHRNEPDGQAFVEDMGDGSWLSFEQVNFGSGTRSFELRLRMDEEADGTIELRLGMPDGPALGSLPLKDAHSGEWFTVSAAMQRITGVQPVFLVFQGSGSLALDWIRFRENPPLPSGE